MPSARPVVAPCSGLRHVNEVHEMEGPQLTTLIWTNTLQVITASPKVSLRATPTRHHSSMLRAGAAGAVRSPTNTELLHVYTGTVGHRKGAVDMRTGKINALIGVMGLHGSSLKRGGPRNLSVLSCKNFTVENDVRYDCMRIWSYKVGGQVIAQVPLQTPGQCSTCTSLIFNTNDELTFACSVTVLHAKVSPGQTQNSWLFIDLGCVRNVWFCHNTCNESAFRCSGVPASSQ